MQMFGEAALKWPVWNVEVGYALEILLFINRMILLHNRACTHKCYVLMHL